MLAAVVGLGPNDLFVAGKIVLFLARKDTEANTLFGPVDFLIFP